MLLALALMITALPPLNIKANNEINYDPDNFTAEEIELIEELANTPGFDASEGELISVSSGRFYFDEPSMTRAGTISPSVMDIELFTFKLSHEGYDSFRFVGRADWLSAPLIRATDAIVLAWSDDFALYDSYCTTAYNSMGVISGKSALISAPPEQGVGYNVDCSYNYGQALDYTLLNAYVRKYDDGIKDNANVTVQYAHATVNVGVGFTVNFKGEGAFDFSSIGTYDSATAYAEIDY